MVEMSPEENAGTLRNYDIVKAWLTDLCSNKHVERPGDNDSRWPVPSNVHAGTTPIEARDLIIVFDYLDLMSNRIVSLQERVNELEQKGMDLL